MTLDGRIIHLAYTFGQGSFPAGTPGNGVPKVILTVGTVSKSALGELYKKHPVCTKIRLFEIQNRFISWEGHSLLLKPLPQWGNDTPSCAILSLFGSHTSFSRKQSLNEHHPRRSRMASTWPNRTRDEHFFEITF